MPFPGGRSINGALPIAALLALGAAQRGEPAETSAPATPATPIAPRPAAPTVEQTFTRLPLYFIENRGQSDPRVGYYVQARGTTAFFTDDGVMFSFLKPPDRKTGPLALPEPTRELPKPNDPGRWAVAMDLEGARPDLHPEAGELTEAIVSYFKGPKEQWKTAIPTYSSVVYRDIWPGIDLVYEGTKGQMKYTYVVAPGGDPARIRLRYRGAPTVRVNAAGELEVKTPLGGILDQRPVAYQQLEGCREDVSARHAVRKAGADYVATFRVGGYDRGRHLYIDPVVVMVVDDGRGAWGPR